MSHKKAKQKLNALTTTISLGMITACGGGTNIANDPTRPYLIAGFGLLNEEGQAGDGEGDGDAGGGEGIGAGGSLGAFKDVVFRVFDENNELIGEASVASDSAVTIFPNLDYLGPLKLEIVGSSSSRYFDESVGASLPTGSGVILRAVAPSYAKSIGITPLSNASATLLATEIAAGRAAAGSIEDIVKINERIREEINTFLPVSKQINDINQLPVLTNERTNLRNKSGSAAGRYAQVLAGFAQVAKNFNPSLPQPALSFSKDLTRDLTDGKIDNVDKDGNPLGPSDQLSYDAKRLKTDLATAIAQVTSEPVETVFPTDQVCVRQFAANGRVYQFNFLNSGYTVGDKALPGSVCSYTSTPPTGVGGQTNLWIDFIYGPNADRPYIDCAGGSTQAWEAFSFLTSNQVMLYGVKSTIRRVAVLTGENTLFQQKLEVLQRSVAEGIGAAC